MQKTGKKTTELCQNVYFGLDLLEICAGLPWRRQNDRHTNDISKFPKKMNEQALKVKVNLLFKNLKKKTLWGVASMN